MSRPTRREAAGHLGLPLLSSSPPHPPDVIRHWGAAAAGGRRLGAAGAAGAAAGGGGDGGGGDGAGPGPGSMGLSASSLAATAAPPVAGSHGARAANRVAALATGGDAVPRQARARLVPLPSEDGDDDDAAFAAAALAAGAAVGGPTISGAATTANVEDAPFLAAAEFQSLVPPPASLRQRGRIAAYCVAPKFDRDALDEVLHAALPASAITSYPDVFHIEYFAASDVGPGGDIFVFLYGVVLTWGLTPGQEAAFLASTVARALSTTPQAPPPPHQQHWHQHPHPLQQAPGKKRKDGGLLSPTRVEVDVFAFQIGLLAGEKPNIKDDTVTLHRRAAKDPAVKLAISYALAQSTKLSSHERAVAELVQSTKHLPEALARHGRVELARGETIARLIGRVFLQRSAVNLLGSLLDTPEFIWRGPDQLQGLYERACDYLELDSRVEVLNARFAVLGDMLDMLRDHENKHHSTRLEWIVIYLIMIEVVVGLIEVLSLFGFFRRK